MDISEFRASCSIFFDYVVPGLLSSFFSDWEDDVHSSYEAFNGMIVNSADKLDKESLACNSVLESLEDINVTAISIETDELCERASSF